MKKQIMDELEKKKGKERYKMMKQCGGEMCFRERTEYGLQGKLDNKKT